MNHTLTQRFIIRLKTYRNLPLSWKLGVWVGLFFINFILAVFLVFDRDNDEYEGLIHAVDRQRFIISEAVYASHKYIHTEDRKEVALLKKSLSKTRNIFSSSFKTIQTGGLQVNTQQKDVSFYIDPEILERINFDERYKSLIIEISSNFKRFDKHLAAVIRKDRKIAIKDSIGVKEIINPEIIQSLIYLDDMKDEFMSQHQAVVNRLNEFTAESNKMSRWKDIVNYFSILAIFILIIVVSRVYIIQRIEKIGLQIKQVSQGNLSIRLQDDNKDEIGDMSSYLNEMIQNLEKAALFAEKIGDGDFGYKFDVLGDKDKLGLSLTNMRDKLVTFAEEDKIRNWSTQGMAKFAEVLQSDKRNIDKFYENIMVNLVKYLDANQGAIYVLNDDMKKGEQTLTMKACYAWGRVKDEEEEVLIGVGLVGQCVLERDHIYITEVPDDFVKITSGLGEANPSSVLIVPLIVNEEVMGVLELASFNDIHPYQIEFVEKLGETIASTISGIKVAERTKKLLDESQELGEAMRSQEEELRQNQEEMIATQEEMDRTIKELEQELKYLKGEGF